MVANQIWHQDISGIIGGSEAFDLFGTRLAVGDFNLDGKDDLAISVFREDIGNIVDAGAVNVIYGSNNGLTATGNQIWHQDIDGVVGGSEADDFFGVRLAIGDFNGDGKDDLAIGVPGEDIGNITRAGAVNVIYGSNTGLTDTGNQIWHQDIDGVVGGSEAEDLFGLSLAVGDFNGDSKDDLAIGVPDEDIGDITSTGAVNVIYGSNNGLTATGNQRWHQDIDGIEGGSEPLDLFGSSLAVGDFDGDGKDDLAIGVPDENIGNIANAGAVNVIYGSNNGLTAAGDQIWHQDISGVEGGSEANDRFGEILAVGDFNGDGKDDLAIGVPGEDIGNIANAGAVNVIYGSNNGLTVAGDQIWHQDISGVEGGSEADDAFGSSLAVGDFNGDGKDDLAIGVPGEDIGNIADAGAVNVLYGSNNGLTAIGDQIWHQDIPGVQGGSEAFDRFGASLAVGNFDGDGKDDLAIGVPGEDIGNIADAGAANVLYGSANGLIV